MPDLVLLLRSVGASVNGGAVDYKSSSSSRGSHLPNQQLPPVGVHCRSPPPPLLLSVGSRGHNQNQLASSSNSSLNSCSSSSENNLSNLQHSVSASSSHNNQYEIRAELYIHITQGYSTTTTKTYYLNTFMVLVEVQLNQADEIKK